MASAESRREWADNPLERLQLIAGDDDAIAEFLDALDVKGPASASCSRSWRRPDRWRFPTRCRRRIVLSLAISIAVWR